MDKRELLEKIINLLRLVDEESDVLKQVPPCDIYRTEDYEKFVNDEMPLDASITFKDHLTNCLACMMGIVECKKQMELEEKKIYEEMYRRTSNFLRGYQKSLSENFLHVALKISEKIIRVLETTAEIIPPSQKLAYRGETQEPSERDTVEIIQTFTTPPLSLQASFEIEEQKGKEDLKITLSIYNRELEEFLDNVEIFVSGENYTKSAATDSEGKAWVTVPRPGEYQITLRFSDAQEIKARINIL